MKIEFPSFVHDLDEAIYHGLPYPGSTDLKACLDRSPMHAKAGMREVTEALAFGSIFHLTLLQPDLAKEKIAVRPADAQKTSNEGKRKLLDWMERTTGMECLDGSDLAEGKMLSKRIEKLQPHMADFLVCSEEDMQRARAMREAVLSRAIGKAIFESGRAEVSGFAEINGVRCKSRYDWLPDGHHAIVDLKSTDKADWADFSRSAARYGYHRQAALYRRVHASITGDKEPAFVFIAVEKDPPHDVGFFELDDESIAGGNADIDRALKIWDLCLENEIWPGAGWDWTSMEYQIETLQLPKWAI